MTPSESELESEQPDSEPVGDAAAIDVPAIPVTPAGQTANMQQPALLQDDDILRVREDADVWIAPRSGIRFHLLGECDGLRRARQVRRLTYGQLQFEFPGQYDMCYL